MRSFLGEDIGREDAADTLRRLRLSPQPASLDILAVLDFLARKILATTLRVVVAFGHDEKLLESVSLPLSSRERGAEEARKAVLEDGVGGEGKGIDWERLR